MAGHRRVPETIYRACLRSSTEGFDLVRLKRYRVSTASLIVICRSTFRYCYACRRTILPQTGARRLLRQALQGSFTETPFFRSLLGPPPAEKANQSNRMSPAGVPMFYGCEDEDTALKETASRRGYYAIGRFETLRSATLLDLTAIPPIPSLFNCVPDSAETQPRRILKFLHHIATEVSRPIERGDREHVEYVPTQVVTEFIRDQVTSGNSRIDGIKYYSSVHPGHVSYGRFASQGSIEGTSDSQWSDDAWLRLSETKHTWGEGQR